MCVDIVSGIGYRKYCLYPTGMVCLCFEYQRLVSCEVQIWRCWYIVTRCQGHRYCIFRCCAYCL